MTKPCLDARKTYYRFLVLLLNCCLTFGSYMVFDMPSVFEKDYLKGTLGLSSTQYSLLYSIYAWTNAAAVLVAGWLIDKLGNRVGVLLFSFLCLFGQTLFATGCYTNKYWLMLTGRLIFGTGGGSITILQNRITAIWFDGKELAMAFGFTLAFSRLGSVLNFLCSASIAAETSPIAVLWGGAVMCGFGFICAIVVTWLDTEGMRQLGLQESLKLASRRVSLRDLTKLPLAYWLLCLIICFAYIGVFPFAAEATSFIQAKYPQYRGDDEHTAAARVAGAVYYVSLVLSPAMGAVVDWMGRRALLISFNAILTIPVFALLAFTDITPLVPILWLGVVYSIASAALWPSIPLLIDRSLIGTAMGVATSIQMLGIGASNQIVGAIRVKTDDVEEELTQWKYVMIYLGASTVLAFVFSLWLNALDARRGGILNKSRAQKKREALMATYDRLGYDESEEEQTSLIN